MSDATTQTEGWFHPSRRPYRFTVLVFVGFMIYGSYFAYDAIGAIENSLMETLNIGQERIGDGRQRVRRGRREPLGGGPSR